MTIPYMLRFVLQTAMCCVMVMLFGCTVEQDLSSDCPSPPCESDIDCDDGLFCNGDEVCDGSVCLSGNPPCGLLLGEPTICNEEFDACP